jgi:hypothetical protein
MGAAAKTEDDETGVMVASTSLKPASEALLAEMEEGLKCHGCHKEHGKLACAACGTTSYCGTLVPLRDRMVKMDGFGSSGVDSGSS